MVTPFGLDELPTCKTTGSGPAGLPVGICTFTCRTPFTRPGAAPAYCGVTVLPPMVTLTGSSGRPSGTAAGAPSWLAGFVWPPPRPYRVTTVPALAGGVGPLIEPS